MPATEVLIQAVAVTSELCGRTFSPAAAAMFVADLEEYPEAQVLRALTRCRKEVRTGLTVADVIARIDDGRPGAEEAWAAIPRDEDASVVWTEEMAAAFGVALPLIRAGEEVQARMAFKEAYLRLVAEAREARTPVRWTPSLGHDPMLRESVIRDAIERGRLPLDAAPVLIPQAAPTAAALAQLVTLKALLKRAPETQS